MFCKNCGQLIADGEIFCGNCGTKVDIPADNQPVNPIMPEPAGAAMPGQVGTPKPPKKKSKKIALIVIPAVLVVAVVIAAVAIYKSVTNTPLAKIMSAAENMISSADVYEVSGSLETEFSPSFSLEGRIKTDAKNGIITINDFSVEARGYGFSEKLLDDGNLYYSQNDELLAGEMSDSDFSLYIYNRDMAKYEGSELYDTDELDKSTYRTLTETVSAVFSILNSNLYSDAGNIADTVNKFLQDNDLDGDIALEDNFADCLQTFIKAAGKKDFQTEVFGLKSTDNDKYEFEIDTAKLLETICEYFGSAITVDGEPLEKILEDPELDEYLPETIELSVQLNKNMIQDVNISFTMEIDGYPADIDGSLHFEKSDEDVTVDTDAIQDKAKR